MRTYLVMAGLLACSPALAAVPLVVDGQPRAVIVVGAEAAPVARYAAEELAEHVRKATGATLAVVEEDAVPAAPEGRVYVGAGRAARAAGLDVARLESEACFLRTAGNALFVVGHDSAGAPLSTDTRAGTLWGVYEVIEQALQARWLWPGDLGTFVPKTRAVVIADVDRIVLPRLMQRNLRSTLHMGRGATGAFSAEAQQKIERDQAVWLRRMRMGRTRRLSYGHAFVGWWQRYGEQHPEWFNLLEDGRRGMVGGDVSMCVSNPGLHEKIIADWLERRKTHPEININACENDIEGLCTCASCRAWDGPQPKKQISERFGRYVVSDRYARFWLTLQQRAAQIDPKALVIGYAYVNYAPPPTTDIRLNENILIGTVPDLFFPRTPEEQEWVKQQWMGWRRTGCRLFLRPNYTLEGYCMPHIYARQFADEFTFEARNGMVATDFDSLTAMWATQGPTLYLLGRLHVRPDADPERLLAEYYAGFGGASRQVKAYFDAWEQYTNDRRDAMRAIATRRRAGWSNYAAMAHEIFPPDSFPPAWRRLDAALKAATDAESRARVEFLRKGLRHAELCARVSAFAAGEGVSPLAGGRAYAELLAYRKATEGENIANFNYCAWIESRSWRIPEGYDGRPLKALSPAPAPLADAALIPARGGGVCLALLKAGERFEADVACQQIGKCDAPCQWTLFGPDDQPLAKGSVAPGEKARVAVPARADGAHVLSTSSGANVTQVLPRNAHAAFTGRTLRFLGECGPLYFLVPAGIERFSVTLESPAPGETAKVTLYDPDGKVVASGSTGPVARQVVEATVSPAQAGRPWSLRVGPAETGVLEDYTLILDPRLPPYWSVAADRLVTPE